MPFEAEAFYVLSLLQYYLNMIFKMFIISQYVHYLPESSEEQ